MQCFRYADVSDNKCHIFRSGVLTFGSSVLYKGELRIVIQSVVIRKVLLNIRLFEQPLKKRFLVKKSQFCKTCTSSQRTLFFFLHAGQCILPWRALLYYGTLLCLPIDQKTSPKVVHKLWHKWVDFSLLSLRLPLVASFDILWIDWDRDTSFYTSPHLINVY